MEGAKRPEKIKYFLIGIVVIAVLLFPQRERVLVCYFCTHGEPVKVEETYVFRTWWLSPFFGNEIRKSVLCATHLREENNHFKNGKRLYDDGLYDKAIAELSEVTYLNPNYPQAQKIIKECKRRLQAQSEKNPKFESMESYTYLLPDKILSYRLQSKFIDSEDGREFLGGCYVPEKRGIISEIMVSVFKLRSSQAASDFVHVQIKSRYPEEYSKEVLENTVMYFGYNEPYYGVCFASGEFAFEVAATGPGSSKGIQKELRQFCNKLLKLAQL